MDNKWLKIGLFVAGGLGLATGLFLTGYKLGQRQVLPAPVPPSTITPLLTTQPETGQPLDETADWKIYERASLGYAIMYPHNFTVSETKDVSPAYSVFFPERQLNLPGEQIKDRLKIYVYEKSMDPERNLAEGERQVSKKIMIAGVEGLMYWQLLPDLSITATKVLVSGSTYNYRISSTLNDKTFNLMLSTFRFLE